MATWLSYAGGASDEPVCPPDALCTFCGSWLSHLEFAKGAAADYENAEQLWCIDEAESAPFASVPSEQRRPTDCTHREDMKLLAAGDIKGAEAAKRRIEEKQRRERKLRAKKR